MLVIAVAYFVAALAREGWYVHAVIVDKPELPVNNEHITVLQISVSDRSLLERLHHLDPVPGEGEEGAAIPQMPLNESAQRLTLDPFHL
jgi:hypothetical protein